MAATIPLSFVDACGSGNQGIRNDWAFPAFFLIHARDEGRGEVGGVEGRRPLLGGVAAGRRPATSPPSTPRRGSQKCPFIITRWSRIPARGLHAIMAWARNTRRGGGAAESGTKAGRSAKQRPPRYATPHHALPRRAHEGAASNASWDPSSWCQVKAQATGVARTRRKVQMVTGPALCSGMNPCLQQDIFF